MRSIFLYSLAFVYLNGCVFLTPDPFDYKMCPEGKSQTPFTRQELLLNEAFSKKSLASLDSFMMIWQADEQAFVDVRPDPKIESLLRVFYSQQIRDNYPTRYFVLDSTFELEVVDSIKSLHEQSNVRVIKKDTLTNLKSLEFPGDIVTLHLTSKYRRILQRSLCANSWEEYFLKSDFLKNHFKVSAGGRSNWNNWYLISRPDIYQISITEGYDHARIHYSSGVGSGGWTEFKLCDNKWIKREDISWVE